MNKKRQESKPKKRRLESEVSQSSGITNLSNVTQTTEISSDFEDNNSDSSSANQFDALNSRRPSTTNGATFQQKQRVQTKRAQKQFARKRQVSWSIDDDDETFEKEVRGQSDTSAQQMNPGQYDNNFAGTNNSRQRVRRNTDGCLDPYALSYNKKPFDEALDRNNRNFQSKLRSNTTSQIHGHENEIQRQIDELIRQHDAQRLQSRRSQSATSLRVNSVQNRSDSHMYESLQSQYAAQNMLNNNPPLDTVVTMTSNDTNYLHPVTETQIHRNNLRKTENMSANSGDESSAYADVMRHNEPLNAGQGQKKCYDFCNNSFYRKGFYILLIFNVILILLNTFGLPYVYFAINQEKEVSKAANLNEGGEFASAVHSEFCVKCDKLIDVVKRKLINSSDVSNKDGQCCVKSAEKLLPILLEIVDDLARVPTPEKTANVPVIQLRADKTRNKNHLDNKNHTIIWQKRPDVGTFRSTDRDDEIKVPKTGYYYVYNRVNYKLPTYEGQSQEFPIIHTINKKIGDKESQLDEVVQRCFPTNTTGDVRHANQLGSIHHLKKGDRLVIKLHHPKYFLPENTLFGMFMVAT